MTAKISKPGVYDISEPVYHADPCPAPSASSTILKIVLRRTPRHAWTAHPRLNPRWKPDNRTTFNLGGAAHKLVLGDRHKELVIVEAADWRGKEAKIERDEAYAANKTPLLHAQYETVVEMAAAAHAQLEVHEDASAAYTDGTPEQTLIWQEDDFWLRMRLDWLPNAEPVFYDYKSTSTSANPDTFHRTLFDLGYDLQASFYRRGIRQVLDVPNPEFKFVVQENYPPYALSVIGLPPAYVDAADKRIEKALEAWRWCLSNDRWPGYSTKTCYVDAPPWVEAQWLEKEAREALAEESGGKHAMLEQMMTWQSPFEEAS